MLSTVPFEVPTYLLDMTADMDKVRMAVAGADNLLTLESAWQAAEAGLIDPVLVGDADEIRSLAHTAGWNIAGIDIVDAPGEDKAPAAAVAMAKAGEVAALMKGYVHTDSLMKAVVNRELGLRTDRRLSHVFHMTVPNSERVLLITDGAINVHPDTGTKIDIINNAVEMAHALGKPHPHVAMLSGTESVINAMPSSVDAAAVVKRAANGEVSGAHVDGPFAFDNAISPDAARLKGIDGPVAGNADILVVPNIEMGNGLFLSLIHI